MLVRVKNTEETAFEEHDLVAGSTVEFAKAVDLIDLFQIAGSSDNMVGAAGLASPSRRK